MMPSTIILLLLAAAPDPQAGGTPEALKTDVESSLQSVRAIPVEKIAPKYPKRELSLGNEAWVEIAFCIDESGSTQNVSVLNSVGAQQFDKAAIEAVKRFKYEPALINGEPSWQSRNSIYITFAIKRRQIVGVSRKFMTQFEEIYELIEQEKLREADELFWHIHETFNLSLYELSKLWALRVRYEAINGDMYRVDKALHRATASKGQWIDKKSYVQLLDSRVQVEVRIGKYYAANSSFRELIKAAGSDAEEVLALKPTMDRLRHFIDSNEVLKLSAEVRTRDGCHDCDNSWSFTPVRNKFRLENITGNLESIEMRCDHKLFQSVISDVVEWHISDDWGTCHVQVYGDPGTTFDVFLLPAA